MVQKVKKTVYVVIECPLNDDLGHLSNTVLAPIKAADFFEGRTDLLLNFSAYFLFHAAQPGVGRLQVLGSKKS